MAQQWNRNQRGGNRPPQNKPPQDKIELIVTAGEVKVETDGKFKVSIEFRATENGIPLKQKKVEIRKDLTLLSVEPTTETGEITMELEEEAASAGKTVKIRFILTEPKVVEKFVEIKFPEDKKLAQKIRLTPIKNNGGYILNIQIEGKPGKFHLVLTEILNEGIASVLPNGASPHILQTNDRGYAQITTTVFNETNRAIYIEVEGTNQHEIVYLDGPQPQKCPRCKSFRWDGTSCSSCNYPKNTIIR